MNKMDLDLDHHSNIKCIPPEISADFQDQVALVFSQLSTQPSSFISALDAVQIQSLCRICNKRTALEGQVIMKEGEIGDYIAILLVGRLSVDQFGKRTACMNCGDAIGEMELCQAGANSRRFATVVALENSVLAEIPYDTFLAYVEGLGSRAARKLSRYMADLVLARVIHHEAEAGKEDRRRLETIGRTRRPAISGPPTNHTPNFARTESDRGLAIIPASDEMQEIKNTLKATFDRIHLLSSMEEDLKALVMKEFTVVKKKHGDIVAKKGEPLKRFYIIHRGSCGIYVPNILRVDPRQNMKNEQGMQTNIIQAIESVGPSRQHLLKGTGLATNRSVGTARSGAGGNTARNEVAPSGDTLPAIANHQVGFSDTFRTIGGSRQQRAILDTTDSPNQVPQVSSWVSPTVGLTARAAEVWRMPSNPHAFDATSPDFFHEPMLGEGNVSDELGESMALKSQRHAGGSEINLQNLLHSARVAIDAEGHDAQQGALGQQKMQAPMSTAKRLANAAHLITHAAASFTSMTQRKKKKETLNPFMGLECAKVLTAHSWFCEIALVHESVHENTVICHNEATLLVLEHEVLHQIRLQYEQQKFGLVRALLERAPFVIALKPDQVCSLVEAAITNVYVPGQTIFSEADSGTMDRFYVLAQGTAIETRGDPKHRKEVKEYREADFFCEWSLYNDPDIALDELRSNPIITAVTTCMCVCIDRHSFNGLFGAYEELLSEFQSNSVDKRSSLFYSGRPSANPSSHARSAHRHNDHHGGRRERRRSISDGFDSFYESNNYDFKRSPRKSPRKKMWLDGMQGTQSGELPPPHRLSISPERRALRRSSVANPVMIVEEQAFCSPNVTGQQCAEDSASHQNTKHHRLQSRLSMLIEEKSDTMIDKNLMQGTVVEIHRILRSADSSAHEVASPEDLRDHIETLQNAELDHSENAVSSALQGLNGAHSLRPQSMIEDFASPVHAFPADDSHQPKVSARTTQSGQPSESLEIQAENPLQEKNSVELMNSALPDVEAVMQLLVTIQPRKQKSQQPGISDCNCDLRLHQDIDGQKQMVTNLSETEDLKPDNDKCEQGTDADAVALMDGEAYQTGLGEENVVARFPRSENFTMEDGDRSAVNFNNPVGFDLQTSRLQLKSTNSEGTPSAGHDSIMIPGKEALVHHKSNKSEGKDDTLPPRTPGEIPKTPGGTVLVNPQGWSSTPSFKSPAATPSQSRVGSSHGLPHDRRNRSTKSHVMASSDEFTIPSGNRNEDDSDDEEQERPRSRGDVPKLPKLRKLNSNSKGNPRVGLRPKSVFGIVEVDAAHYAGHALRLPREASAVDKIYKLDSRGGPNLQPRLHKSGGKGPRAAQFDKNQTRSALEWNLLKEAALPGPGAYNLPVKKKLGCLNIGRSNRRPVWFDLEKKATESPGPGEYEASLGRIEIRTRRAAAVVELLQARRAKGSSKPVRVEVSGGGGGISMSSGVLGSTLEESVMACIERHSGADLDGLPEQSQLCYELRAVESIRRAYLDHGIDL